MIKLGNQNTWIKSSYSCGNGASCVEVMSSTPTVVQVKDSKLEFSPVLDISPEAFCDFVSSVRG
jgi:hypothetical protein